MSMYHYSKTGSYWNIPNLVEVLYCIIFTLMGYVYFDALQQNFTCLSITNYFMDITVLNHNIPFLHHSKGKMMERQIW
jgi:hypothetical protein